MTFIPQRQTCSPVTVTVNGQRISQTGRSQIFRNTPGSQAKLEKTHIYQAQTTRVITGENVWLFGRKSQLSTENKLLLYNTQTHMGL